MSDQHDAPTRRYRITVVATPATFVGAAYTADVDDPTDGYGRLESVEYDSGYIHTIWSQPV